MNYNFSLKMETMIMQMITGDKNAASHCWHEYRELLHLDLGKDLYTTYEVEQEMKRRMKVELLRFFPDIRQKCGDFFALNGCSYVNIILTTEQELTYEPFKLVADELQAKIRKIQEREKEIYKAQVKARVINEVCLDSTEITGYTGGSQAIYT